MSANKERVVLDWIKIRNFQLYYFKLYSIESYSDHTEKHQKKKRKGKLSVSGTWVLNFKGIFFHP